MGEAGEGRNIAHQQQGDERGGPARDPRPPRAAAHRRAGDPARFFHRPPAGQPRGFRYLLERRAALGGSIPARNREADRLPTPAPFESVLEGSGERENSTTMAFVRILNALVRDEAIGPRVVPIVPDESRTFGMEGMFRQLGIFSQVGQLYQPEDSGDFMFYREQHRPGPAGGHRRGRRVLGRWHRGTGPRTVRTRSWQRSRSTSSTRCSASSAWATLAWAAADRRARGFLMGGAPPAARRSTAKGLQREDGHRPSARADDTRRCRACDPAFGYAARRRSSRRGSPHMFVRSRRTSSTTSR